MKNFILIGLLIWMGNISNAISQQKEVNIHVLGAFEEDTSLLIGASVYWANSIEGTATNENGIATLPFHKQLPHDLVITYVGLKNDTLTIFNEDKKHYYVYLLSDDLLSTIEIIKKRKSSFISELNPIRTDILDASELKKAACCDLSESFQTNASVDVSYSDAITGAKEIKLLGLDGVYVEMLQENVPVLRGIAIPFGLSFVPGPWLQTISISKGAGSVLNGHESITGSINYQYKRPFETEPFYLDLFGNHFGRYETNVVTGYEINKGVAGVVALNVGGMHSKHDKNHDHFLDMNLYDRIGAMNRWEFYGEKMEGQLSINYLMDDRTSGETHFKQEDRGTTNAYGFGMKTNRVEAFAKTGFFLPKKDVQSLGIIYSFNWQEQNGFFGLSEYKGKQLSFNTSLLYQTIIKTTDHSFTLGGNAYTNNYDEKFNEIHLVENDWNIGAYLEYTYSFLEKLKIVSGLRLDYHNIHNVQISPRIHVKWSPTDLAAFRISAGRGFRSPRVLGENISLMASSRAFNILETPGKEAAWNTGISFVQKFKNKERHGYLATDYFYTRFQEQVIVDVNEGDNLINIYNLNGQSYAHSFLIEVSYELFKGMDFKLAYKLDDVKTTLGGKLQSQPFTFLHKGLVTASYDTPNHQWQFDLNMDMHGKHVLPASFSTDVDGNTSPIFIQLNMQISKFFDNGIEIYVGGENITNYTQKNPIIGADNPFGDNFDTAQIWGPVVGGMFYGGLRYKLKKKGAS